MKARDVTFSERINELVQRKKHFIALDGLRGVAAISVMLFHRRWWAPNNHLLDHAYLAVDFFFMLSGFVIAYAYRTKLLDGMGFGYFSLVRAVRLYPLAILGATLGIAGWVLRAFYHHESSLIGIAASLPFALLVIPTLPTLMTEPFAINRPSWSLFVELLLNAVYASFIVRLGRNGLVFAIGISLAIEVLIAYSHGGLIYNEGFANLPAIILRGLYPFLIGVAIERLFQRRLLPRLPGGFITGTIVLLLAFLPNADFLGSANWLYDLAMVVFIFPAIIVAACEHEPQGALRSAANLSGELSYPLYITHYPFYFWFEAVGRSHIAPSLWLPTSAALIIIWSFFISRCFDIPVRRWLGNKIRKPPIELPTARTGAPH